jgi:hypothetical protein
MANSRSQVNVAGAAQVVGHKHEQYRRSPQPVEFGYSLGRCLLRGLGIHLDIDFNKGVSRRCPYVSADRFLQRSSMLRLQFENFYWHELALAGEAQAREVHYFSMGKGN